MSVDCRKYLKSARFVPNLTHGLLDLLELTTGQDLLDLGCGDGELTSRLIDKGFNVTAVDINEGMVEAARERGIPAHCIDARDLSFCDEFDIVLSNAVLHWFSEHDQVCQNVYRSLKPGGHFIAECGGYGNVDTIIKGIEASISEDDQLGTFSNPWTFRSAEEFKDILIKTGFEVIDIQLIPRPTVTSCSLADWLDTFLSDSHLQLNKSSREEFFNRVSEKAYSALYDKQDGWILDYVRLRFIARKI
ncbi:class I SAM-dependent methyltransferase [Corallincola platygyrae]|uniref:Class I SAM-dependent methyltransferase n=1 Tax=Corallincola platygyrae TaxID=1193278 RepID=A0ABW4XI43_9GAMM